MIDSLRADQQEKDALVALKDPLSEVTRRERRALLALSTLCYVIARVGLVPTKISALGIDFNHSDQKTLFRILAGILVYLIVAFVIYASADFIAWRIARAEVLRGWWNKNIDQLKEEATPANLQTAKIREQLGMDMSFICTSDVTGFAGIVSTLRGFVDFFFPVLFGGYCVGIMITEAM